MEQSLDHAIPTDLLLGATRQSPNETEPSPLKSTDYSHPLLSSLLTFSARGYAFPSCTFTPHPNNMRPVLLVLIFVSAAAGGSAANFRSTAASYFLPGNKKDPCYDEPYISDRAECIARLVTLYYDDYFAANCPNAIQWLANQKCKGCPWDNIDVSAITPAISRNLNRSELFHAPAMSCSLAQYLREIYSSTDFPYYCFFGFAIPLFSGIFLAKSDANGSPTTPHVFGSRLKEPIYFVSLWLLFFVGYGMSIAGHELYDACHDPLSFISLETGDWINLAVMLWTSLWRCRYLEARDRPGEVISWASYRGSGLYRASPIWHKRLVDSVCGAGPVLILISVVLNKTIENEKILSVCLLGSYKSIPYGLIQYSKLAIGILAVGVYSFGPPKSAALFYTRYLFLISILFVSLSLLHVMELPVYAPQCSSSLIPHVADCAIAGPVHAGLPAHSLAVTLLGIAEPLRLGWPERRKVKRFSDP